ncbi:MAG: ClpXP protease specificity-enhancing factor SspB [Hyphomonadaceae bacterium]
MERTPGSGKDHIGFHALTQAALRGVVRAAMDKVARMGHLPGDHHFYVTFRTRLQGVQMADWLKDKFPDEMTIVIQHQFWDFEIFDDRFQISLKFGGDLQPLRVPFTAISRFFDPSTNFGVQLDTVDSRANVGAPTILPEKKPAADGAPAAPAEVPEGTVVSLDAFRRK